MHDRHEVGVRVWQALSTTSVTPLATTCPAAASPPAPSFTARRHQSQPPPTQTHTSHTGSREHKTTPGAPQYSNIKAHPRVIIIIIIRRRIQKKAHFSNKSAEIPFNAVSHREDFFR